MVESDQEGWGLNTTLDTKSREAQFISSPLTDSSPESSHGVGSFGYFDFVDIFSELCCFRIHIKLSRILYVGLRLEKIYQKVWN